MFGNDHHDVSVFDPMHLSSRLSPVSSSMGSMPSPGSPPTSTAFYEKLPPGLAITALAAAGSRPSMSSAQYGHSSGAVSPMSPPIGGGKMKSPGSGSGRKKAPVTEVGQEDEELLNIPSLQVRISILQQRVSHRNSFIFSLNFFFCFLQTFIFTSFLTFFVILNFNYCINYTTDDDCDKQCLNLQSSMTNA